MLIDKGLNDRWIKPEHLKRVGKNRYRIRVKETLGRSWAGEIVSCPLPSSAKSKDVCVTLAGAKVQSQLSDGRLSIFVENLQSGEDRAYEVHMAGESAGRKPAPDISLVRRGAFAIFTNGRIALKLPAASRAGAVPGPIVAVRRGAGPWIGRGRLETPVAVHSIQARLIEEGELWATAEVHYRFSGGYRYRVRLRLCPNDDACEVTEESTLPVRLWPALRPYREIGSLAQSHWDQSRDAIAKPCLRPCPTSNFIFDVAANRMITHSTGSWELMDMPLGSATVKTYTAMRPALSFIDGGWMGVYHDTGNDLVGVVALDIAHWKTPDDVVHPAHRTPGASEEVLLVDGKSGPHFRFPIERLTRRWLVVVGPRPAHEPKPGQPMRLDPDPSFPLWALHTRRGDLRLDKVKDWVADWPDADEAHPRVLCRRSDFAAIRKKIETVPEFRRNHAEYGKWRGADRYILTGEGCGLKHIEEQTHACALVEGILARGYVGPTYCIGFARPLRRYALACDILWDSFTPEEKREARRVCALAAYILTDGDFWQYAYRAGETTYLPNFNTDIFTCAGIIGLFLHDHPCANAWVRFCVDRMDIELKHTLHLDGGGDENIGNYYFSTWTQLYLPAMWALRHCGVKDYSGAPEVLASGRFMLKVFGPPDPRDNGGRMIPPIGHHPHVRKAFPVMDWLASFVKNADPALAAQLKWAWRRSGSPVGNFHDHSGPRANPLTRHYIFHDTAMLPVEPELKSHELPRVGVVLRSHDSSGQGSFLFLKAGDVHSHHEDDEGSIHYFGRGVPLALDGLPLQNGTQADEHNAVTFGKPGRLCGLVQHFKTTAVADYVRVIFAPRSFSCDANYVDDSHRSGWTREVVLVKASKPGGVEYLVVKDSCVGPEPCQWNLDVLSQQPILAAGRIWFPGHKELKMGIEVIVAEPSPAKMLVAPGVVNPLLLDGRKRRRLPAGMIRWKTVEHWLLHMPAPPGTTFAVVLFPRRATELSPVIEYLAREETFAIRHAEGRDLVFLRPNPMVGVNVDGVSFRGRAGIVYERNRRRIVQQLDAAQLCVVERQRDACRIL